MDHYVRSTVVASETIATVADLYRFFQSHEGLADFDATYLRGVNTVQIIEGTLEDGSKVYDLAFAERDDLEPPSTDGDSDSYAEFRMDAADVGDA